MMEEEGEDGARRKRKVRFDTANFTEWNRMRTLSVGMVEGQEEDSTEDFGVGTNFAKIWERKGSIDVFDLQNDFYLVKFQRSEDYMEALTGGPWVINDAYLNVSRWRLDFNPKNERIASVVAWVRLPDLPAPLFDKKFLLNLGNVIGKAIKLDIHTAQ
ncbi:hypothetical protein K1719_040660 [Acacia pycnantha]|nr:hypothetical protein K1719_040660 [Acacia pycnantha]